MSTNNNNWLQLMYIHLVLSNPFSQYIIYYRKLMDTEGKRETTQTRQKLIRDWEIDWMWNEHVLANSCTHRSILIDVKVLRFTPNWVSFIIINTIFKVNIGPMNYSCCFCRLSSLWKINTITFLPCTKIDVLRFDYT